MEQAHSVLNDKFTRPGALGLCRSGLGVSLPAESDISREARRNTSGNLYTGKTTREGLR